MSFYYLFQIEWWRFQQSRKSKSNKKIKLRKHTAHNTWETTRYELEIKNRMHERRNLSYLMGYFVGDWDVKTPSKECRILTDNEILQSHDLIVIVRWPLPVYLRPYIPVNVRALERVTQDYEYKQRFTKNKNMGPECTEDLKLNAICLAASLDIKHHHEHASHYHLKLPAWFRCDICGSKDHSQDTCIQTIKTYIPKKHRQIPHGIPKNDLRTATVEEANSIAMIDVHGEYFMFRENVQTDKDNTNLRQYI